LKQKGSTRKCLEEIKARGSVLDFQEVLAFYTDIQVGRTNDEPPIHRFSREDTIVRGSPNEGLPLLRPNEETILKSKHSFDHRFPCIRYTRRPLSNISLSKLILSF